MGMGVLNGSTGAGAWGWEHKDGSIGMGALGWEHGDGTSGMEA